MESKRLIFRVKDGVQPSEVLPASPLSVDGGGIQIERLYDIGDEVSSFLGAEPSELGLKSDETLFRDEIYPQKPEAEQKLYRTYVASGETDEATDSMYESLKENENIEYVQYDETNELYLTPNDAFFDQLWGIAKINCPDAWDIAQGDDVTVAVIDSGVDYNHPDIRANMWTDANGNYGIDYSDGDDDPMDPHGHGSHCAGTIAAVINNGRGVVGVAPKAKIMAIKIFPSMADTVCARAIRYAADKGAKVLSNSWGPTGRRPLNQAVVDAVDYAFVRRCIVIFAAGNNDDDVQFYSPANYRERVISVAATNPNDTRWTSSNHGNLVTVAAPGVDILSLERNTGGYVRKQGTSMACPHVAGLVALLLSINPNLTFNQVREILRANSDAITPDKPIGSGRINAVRSINALNGLA